MSERIPHQAVQRQALYRWVSKIIPRARYEAGCCTPDAHRFLSFDVSSEALC
jgi:hypothetical protein